MYLYKLYHIYLDITYETYGNVYDYSLCPYLEGLIHKIIYIYRCGNVNVCSGVLSYLEGLDLCEEFH
jgi:hypothetical protein